MVVLRTGFIKCVVVGDDHVGKTSMLVNYATNKFPTTHVPSVFDNYAGNVAISGKQYHLQLLDTLGNDAEWESRKNIFPGTDVFVVCFSVVNPESYKNIEKKWIPQIRRYMGDIPFILVGTQTDLRRNINVVQELRRSGSCPITSVDGNALARKVGASYYIECSPSLEKRVKRVINKAIETVLHPKETHFEDHSCTIL